MKISFKIKIICVFLFFLAFLSPLITLLTAPTGESETSQIVPLLGLDFQLHILVFYIIWPLLLSIISVIVFPLLLTPLFLFIKRRIWFKFDDCYVDKGELEFNLMTFFKRGVYISLLIVGLIITLSNSLGANLFLTPQAITDTYYSSNLLFDPAVIMGIAYLIFPIVIGLWSVGWTLEDTGLMHYRFPEENDPKLFEIEPIHLKYNGIVKGYAGVSSIIFLITAIQVYLAIWPGHIAQVVMSILAIMFYAIPAYLVYLVVVQKLFRKILRKGVKEIVQLTAEVIKEK